MKSRYTRPLVAASVVAMLALPAAAVGKGHGGAHGRSADHKGAQHTRALNLKGTVSAVGDNSVDVLVKRANHHGHVLVGQTVTVDLSNARVVVRDVNGDGVRNLSDVAVGDRVVVQARIAKGGTADASQPLAAKRLVDQGAPRSGGSGDDTGSGDDSDTPTS